MALRAINNLLIQIHEFSKSIWRFTPNALTGDQLIKTFSMRPILWIPVILILALSCNENSNDIKPINGEISFRSGHFLGKLHRAKILTDSGRTCGCEACFGICNFHWEEDGVADGEHKIGFLKQGSDTYLYLMETVSHAESQFVVDYDITVSVDEGGTSLVQRTLLAGSYSFVPAGFYTNPSGMPTTYGRVLVAVQ